jgi:signal peptidase I
LDTNQLEVNQELAGPQPRKSGFLRFIKDVLETLVLSIVLFVGVNIISARIRVDGASMEPTLDTGEYVIVNRLSYRLGTPQRGDIIVFHPPLAPQEEYIKRVIGLPWDEVEVRDGMVYVNGQALNETYLSTKTNYPGTWRVPAGQLFVLGDNRNNSSDSHEWGTLALASVVGKAVVVYWPPPDWELITHVPLANAAH